MKALAVAALGSFGVCAAALLWGAPLRQVAAGWLFFAGSLAFAGAFAYVMEGGRA